MKDTQLYEQLLGLSKPWSVSQVEVELEHNRITVHVQRARDQVWGDPETLQDRAHVHGCVQREWRHLDTCQFETLIKAEVPRLNYKSGRVEEATAPWAERYSGSQHQPRGSAVIAGSFGRYSWIDCVANLELSQHTVFHFYQREGGTMCRS